VFLGAIVLQLKGALSLSYRPLAGFTIDSKHVRRTHHLAQGEPPISRRATAPQGDPSTSDGRPRLAMDHRGRLVRTSDATAAVLGGAIHMSLENIDHIVVLVMENRSFDHMLGYRFGNASERVNPKKLDGSVTTDVRPMRLEAPRFTPGPHHTYPHVARQLAVVSDGMATMRGFVDDYATVSGVRFPEMAMGYYDQTFVPVYDYFADNYLVCDRWFCSVPGPTLPNRCFLFAGHSDGIVDNIQLGLHLLTHRVETIFDHLSAHDVSWNSYYHDVPSLRFFKQFTASLDRIRKIDQFYRDAEQGSLPSVSWIDPNFTVQSAFPLPGQLRFPDAANDDHPPADIRDGQRLVLNVYSALRKNEAQWAKTLFIVTYDEHGGFYDHVPPPVQEHRAPFNNRLFSRFGVRVPTFLVSPWVQKGAKSSDLASAQGIDFEHTSIPKTIMDRFCPSADLSAMGERIGTAPSLQSLLSTSAQPMASAGSITPTLPQLEADDRLAVGGAFNVPSTLDDTDHGTDFHHLVAALGAHAAKTRRAPT
jgi:phospholipase C